MAIKAIGLKALAAGLGIREQSINNWRRVPRGRIMQVERLTGVSRELLAPDLYAPQKRARPFRWRKLSRNRGA